MVVCFIPAVSSFSDVGMELGQRMGNWVQQKQGFSRQVQWRDLRQRDSRVQRKAGILEWWTIGQEETVSINSLSFPCMFCKLKVRAESLISFSAAFLAWIFHRHCSEFHIAITSGHTYVWLSHYILLRLISMRTIKNHTNTWEKSPF